MNLFRPTIPWHQVPDIDLAELCGHHDGNLAEEARDERALRKSRKGTMSGGAGYIADKPWDGNWETILPKHETET